MLVVTRMALLLSVGLGACCTSAALAQSAPPRATRPAAPRLEPVRLDGPVVTLHRGAFNGKQIVYDAIVEPFETLDLNGKPATKLVATSYIAKDSLPTRPVIFVFNGGPIAATTYLHLGVFGPKRVAVPNDIKADPATFQVTDNPYSPLDATDVVIFDPANTGYSRTLPGVDPNSQYSVTEDGRQLAQLVTLWLARHQRPSAPVYIAGESYGTIRAPEAATQLAKSGVAVSGIVLLGQAVNVLEYSQRRDNIISYAVSLPTLAALGWAHNKVDKAGRTFEQFVKEAEAYGAGEYLSVLFLGNRADPARREAVARKLEAFTGLPAAIYLREDLKVAKTLYQRELFPGFVLNTNDARYMRAVDGQDSLPDYNGAAVKYIADFLKVPATVGVYSTAAPNRGWDYGPSSPFTDFPWVRQIRELMKSNPKLRIFVGNGYYDTQTTIGAMDYLVAQSAWPMDRVKTRYYVGGHIMYSVEASAKQIGEDVRALVTGKW